MPSDAELSIFPISESASSTGPAVKLEEQIAGLFKKFRVTIYRYLVSAGASPADAEEITQEAFLRLYRSLHSGRPIRHARSWLLRVAHNLAVERYKKGVSSRALNAAIEDAAALVGLRTGSSLDPEQIVLQKERWTRLKTTWLALTPRQKQCLRLRMEGLRYREIGEILDISISTVSDSLERSIAKLMKGTDA